MMDDEMVKVSFVLFVSTTAPIQFRPADNPCPFRFLWRSMIHCDSDVGGPGRGGPSPALADRHGSQVVTIYATAAGDPGSNPALGKHGHVTTRSSSPRRPTPTLPDANLRCQDALDWRK